MKRIVIYLSLCIIFLSLSVLLPGTLAAEEEVHKKFTYYVYWAGIRAGKAVMDYDGTADSIKIRTHATSAKLITFFYKVDDVAESILYPDGYPMKHTLVVRQGRHRRHKITEFERQENNRPQKVIYQNVLKKTLTEHYLDRPAYDSLSAFFELTKRPLTVGNSEYIDVFDSNKLYNAEVKVLGKERIKVPAGEFDTILVKPILKSEGIFIKKGDIYIWVTDDDRRLPVLFKSKVKIGHFTVQLIEGTL